MNYLIYHDVSGCATFYFLAHLQFLQTSRLTSVSTDNQTSNMDTDTCFDMSAKPPWLFALGGITITAYGTLLALGDFDKKAPTKTDEEDTDDVPLRVISVSSHLHAGSSSTPHSDLRAPHSIDPSDMAIKNLDLNDMDKQKSQSRSHVSSNSTQSNNSPRSSNNNNSNNNNRLELNPNAGKPQSGCDKCLYYTKVFWLTKMFLGIILIAVLDYYMIIRQILNHYDNRSIFEHINCSMFLLVISSNFKGFLIGYLLYTVKLIKEKANKKVMKLKKRIIKTSRQGTINSSQASSDMHKQKSISTTFASTTSGTASGYPTGAGINWKSEEKRRCKICRACCFRIGEVFSFLGYQCDVVVCGQSSDYYNDYEANTDESGEESIFNCADKLQVIVLSLFFASYLFPYCIVMYTNLMIGSLVFIFVTIGVLIIVIFCPFSLPFWFISSKIFCLCKVSEVSFLDINKCYFWHWERTVNFVCGNGKWTREDQVTRKEIYNQAIKSPGYLAFEIMIVTMAALWICESMCYLFDGRNYWKMHDIVTNNLEFGEELGDFISGISHDANNLDEIKSVYHLFQSLTWLFG